MTRAMTPTGGSVQVESLDTDKREVLESALMWPDRARALSILGSETYVEAGTFLKGIKALRQKIAETFDPHIRRAFEAHRALCREKQEAEAPLIDAEGILKRGLAAYDTEQERLRREEERRRQEEARRQEEERRLAEAAAMESEAAATGDQVLLDEAMALLDAPIETPTIAPTEKTTPKIVGVSYREEWKFRVVDPLKVPREYLQVDERKIGGVVRAMKGSTKIAGIEVYAVKNVAASGR